MNESPPKMYPTGLSDTDETTSSRNSNPRKLPVYSLIAGIGSVIYFQLIFVPLIAMIAAVAHFTNQNSGKLTERGWMAWIGLIFGAVYLVAGITFLVDL